MATVINAKMSHSLGIIFAANVKQWCKSVENDPHPRRQNEAMRWCVIKNKELI